MAHLLDVTQASRAFLTELREQIENHPAVNHLFLNRLATAPFSRQDYRVFAENHYPLVCVFTQYLEMLLVRAPDSESKLWLAKVLVDEYGEGSDGDDHATLYGGFLQSCGGDLPAQHVARVPRPALRFVREHRQVCASSPFLVGLGAVGPGHEWAIPKMFASIIPGLRRAGFEEREIHYFTLHVLQDGDHGSWLEEALATYATTDQARAQIREGAMLSLAARGRFWDGVQSAVVTYRQPRLIRPTVERSIPRELFTTAWDGMSWARRLEARVGRFGETRRPTLDALVLEGRSLLRAPRTDLAGLAFGAR
jgi:pyrroloquinoline-quinone synthase